MTERPKKTLYALLVALSGGAALLGFAREAVVGALFGAGRETDAFYAALALPFTVAYFLVGGALAPPLTASVAALLEKGDEPGARRLFGASLRSLLLGLGLAAGALLVASVPMARLLVPGFDEAGIQLTARLLQRLAAYGVLTSTGLLISSVLTAAGAYRTPVVATLCGNGAAVFFLVAAGRRAPIETAAWALVVGSGVALVTLLPRVVSLRLVPELLARDVALPWRDSAVLALSLAFAGTIDLLERSFASGAGVGAVAILAFASKLIHLPMRLFAAPLASVAFPRFVRGRARRELSSHDEAGATANLALKFLVFAAAVTAGAAGPIVSLTLGRGRFDAAAVSKLATVLALLAPAIVAIGFIELAGKYLLAGERSPAVAWAHGAGLAIYVAAAFSLRGFGVNGLAVARDLAWGAAALGLALSLLRHEKRLRLLQDGWLTLGATAVAVVLAAVASGLVPGGSLVRLSAAGALACAPFVALLVVSRGDA